MPSDRYGPCAATLLKYLDTDPYPLIVQVGTVFVFPYSILVFDPDGQEGLYAPQQIDRGVA